MWAGGRGVENESKAKEDYRRIRTETLGNFVSENVNLVIIIEVRRARQVVMCHPRRDVNQKAPAHTRPLIGWFPLLAFLTPLVKDQQQLIFECTDSFLNIMAPDAAICG